MIFGGYGRNQSRTRDDGYLNHSQVHYKCYFVFNTTCNNYDVNICKLVLCTMVVVMVLVRGLLTLLPYYIALLPSDMIFCICLL